LHRDGKLQRHPQFHSNPSDSDPATLLPPRGDLLLPTGHGTPSPRCCATATARTTRAGSREELSLATKKMPLTFAASRPKAVDASAILGQTASSRRVEERLSWCQYDGHSSTDAFECPIQCRTACIMGRFCSATVTDLSDLGRVLVSREMTEMTREKQISIGSGAQRPDSDCKINGLIRFVRITSAGWAHECCFVHTGIFYYGTIWLVSVDRTVEVRSSGALTLFPAKGRFVAKRK
jgi:hypothetical protein